MMVQELLVIIILWAAFYQAGFANESGSGFLSIQLENDLWGSNDDRFYTHGTKVSFASDAPPPEFLQQITELIPFYQQGEVLLQGFEIGQTIFTPQDITQKQLIQNDRPYAGWLFFNMGTGHMIEDRGDREKLNFFLLTIGLVGPSSLAEESQNIVHEIFNATEPQGWNNQLHDELGINASYLLKWRKIHNFDEPRQNETGYHVALTLGNVYSLAAAGFMWRYGTHLKTDFGPPTILPGFTGVPAFNPNQQSNGYLFAGIEGRLMARNIFLDGNTFRDSHSVEREYLVADLQFGAAYHYNDMRVSFTQLWRSKEFAGQDKYTQYGAINFTIFTE